MHENKDGAKSQVNTSTIYFQVYFHIRVHGPYQDEKEEEPAEEELRWLQELSFSCWRIRHLTCKQPAATGNERLGYRCGKHGTDTR